MSKCLLVLLLLLSTAGHSFAQPLAQKVRVLLKFDMGGHQIVRVVRIGGDASGLVDDSTRTSARLSDAQHAQNIARQLANQHKRSIASREASMGILAKSASVTWVDGSGAILLSELLSDPRIAHAPQLAARQSHQPTDFSLRQQGVYLLTGPADATELRLVLPAIELDGQVRPAEQWVLSFQ